MLIVQCYCIAYCKLPIVNAYCPLPIALLIVHCLLPIACCPPPPPSTLQLFPFPYLYSWKHYCFFSHSIIGINNFSREWHRSKSWKSPRPRIPFDGTPGTFNAITDVPGIEVGYSTIISGKGKLEYGKGPVRTGVTVILPKGKTGDSYPAAWFSLNGDGEMTGLPYVQDYGMGSGAIGITNTNSVGVVRDAIGEWSFKKFSNQELIDFSFGLPIVGETWDGCWMISWLPCKKKSTCGKHWIAHMAAALRRKCSGGTAWPVTALKGGSGTLQEFSGLIQPNIPWCFCAGKFGGRNGIDHRGVPWAGRSRLQTGNAPTQKKRGIHHRDRATDAPLCTTSWTFSQKTEWAWVSPAPAPSHDG